MRALFAVATLLAAAATGCIGSSVVDKRGARIEPVCPAVSVTCAGAADVPVIEPMPPEAFASPVSACVGRSSIVLGPGDDLAERTIDCADISIDLGAGETLDIRGAALRDVNISARGADGAVLRLSGTTAERVHIALAGHAWLVVADRSELTDVVADAAREMEGAVVTVSRSTGSSFSVRTGARGGVRVEQSELAGGVLELGTLDAEESQLHDVRLFVDAAHLSASGLFGGTSEVGTGVLVDTLVSGSQIQRCGSLRFVTAMLRTAFVASCDRTTAFVGGAIVDSRVLGALELSGTDVTGSRLVPGHTAALTLIDALVRDSVFCGADELIADGGELTCDGCAPEIARIMLGDVYVDTPECPSLQAAAPP